MGNRVVSMGVHASTSPPRAGRTKPMGRFPPLQKPRFFLTPKRPGLLFPPNRGQVYFGWRNFRPNRSLGEYTAQIRPDQRNEPEPNRVPGERPSDRELGRRQRTAMIPTRRLMAFFISIPGRNARRL